MTGDIMFIALPQSCYSDRRGDKLKIRPSVTLYSLDRSLPNGMVDYVGDRYSEAICS